MITEILFTNEAREKMKAGVDKIGNAVKVTLGAKGRNVAIRNDRSGKGHVTKDGVTVARSINLPDKTEDMGAQMIKEAALKTAEIAGDGTTTSTILAQAMITEGMIALSAGANPVGIKKGMDKAVALVLENLQKQSRQITPENKIDVATISANNDREIGVLVADALTKVGDNGIVYLQDSKTADTYTEKVDGLQLDRGYISPYFVNNTAKMLVDFDNAFILLCERKVSSYHDLEPAMLIAVAEKRPLLIIAEDVDSEALAVLITNKLKQNLPFAAIKLPGYGNMQQQILEDIAVITGGKVISEAQGDMLRAVKRDMLGQADKISISSITTNIIGGKGQKKDIEDRIKQVQALIANHDNEVEKEKLRTQRLAKLCNGVAVIYVGATTEVEMREKKDRVDDSLRATTAAIREGIVPGGGIAYLRAIDALPIEFDDKDETTGLNIISGALSAPLSQILINAGLGKSDIFSKLAQSAGDYGYNVKSEKFEQFFETGIIDPALVSRVALENAASVASMFLTTECTIVDI